MRLQRVQKQRLTHQLLHGIEQAKINISDNTHAQMTLEFIESTLSIDINREQVSETMVNWLYKMFVMIEQSIPNAKKLP
ncbi:heat-shock protein Hsp70, partial [Psychromonas aquatilis]